MNLVYTLVCDGSSDKCLLHVIDWAVRDLGHSVGRAQYAELNEEDTKPLVKKRRFSPKENDLTLKVRAALRKYPCDILFIHRDSEGQPWEMRVEEIREAEATVQNICVPVITVKMMEAWLLHDRDAICMAAGNPSFFTELNLPKLNKLEELNDPKECLNQALKSAARPRKRRRKKATTKDFGRMRASVAENIMDYTPLLKLPAFKRFLENLKQALEKSQHHQG